MYDFYSTDAFESAFTYTGNDLGAVWTKDATHFRLWAPTAKNVCVVLYRSGDKNNADILDILPMAYDTKGTWQVTASGDLNGVYYTYRVQVGGKTVEAADPYARTTGVNGHRSMVLDLKSTDPALWEDDGKTFSPQRMTDCILYELHVRDLSMDKCSGICNKGKFLGLGEEKTAYRGNPTGLEHIKQLGITHLHLLPIYDYGYTDESLDLPQFNWGYDPENFNVPEGSYATDPYNGAVRVTQMKQMVKTLHDNDIRLVMDVVYNHVFHTDEFCFNRIVPGYFSRIHEDGYVSNGSCCGNDTASERSMVRKYIVDSVNYWADEYHIDGFRFDLAGLIDTKTILQIMDTVRRKHPHVIFYGEGWNMETLPTKPNVDMAIQGNAGKLPGFAFFNDTARDLLRGSIFDSTLPGYVSGAICSKDMLHAAFMGMPSWAQSPTQSVNYVSCHDNNTLFDRIVLGAPESSRHEHIRMNNLAAAFTLLSQGIPFMQAGEEILRTKPAKKGTFDHNSYRSPDCVNAIKWSSLVKKETKEVLAYYKGLIAFRKAHPALRMDSASDVYKNIHPIHCENPHVAAFLIDGKDEELFIVFNANRKPVSISLPEGNWNICIRDNLAGIKTLGEVSGITEISSISAFAAIRNKPRPPIDVVAALIWEKDKFLICQRPAHKARGLLWEFVGGKTEPGETLQQALIRECREELNITVDVGSPFMSVIHEYPDIHIRLSLFHCTIPEGYPEALEHNDIQWIHPRQIDEYQFCPADTDILKEIKRLYAHKKPL